jgi:transcription elongation factor GreA
MTDKKTYYLTNSGLEKVKKEYDFLKNLMAAKTKGETPEMWESEDLNPEYLSFVEDITLIEARIAELEGVLENTQIIKPSSEKASFIDLGATVSIEVEGDKDEFTIVGTLEANPAMGKISNESPVGKALMGHKVGDEVIVSSPIKVAYKIKDIKYKIS